MTKPVRPTSPHLTIYKKQISSVLSIFHRISGAGLFVFMMCFTWWFIAVILMDFPPLLLSIFEYKIVKIALFLASIGICYHMCSGVRHLIWDLGYGFSVPVMNVTGWIVVFCSIIFTLIFWFFII